MNIKLIEEKPEEITFILEDANPAFANTLRRIAKSEIPVMAIENIDIEENTSGMFDEALAHRIGLIPLVFDNKFFSLKSECKCKGKGCNLCEAVLVLEKTGPCMVKSSDLIPADNVKPLDPNIPIVSLLAEQKLKLEATAQLGLGIDHIKYQAAHVSYKNIASIRVYNDKDPHIKKIIKLCPKNVFEEKDGYVKTARSEDCILCMKCVEAAENNAVIVNADETRFIFTIESVCGLKARQILESALNILEKRTQEFINEVKKVVK